MTSNWKTITASLAAFSLGVLSTIAFRPVNAMPATPAERGHDLIWEFADGTLHLQPRSPEKTFIVVAPKDESPGWIWTLPTDRETALPVADIEGLVVAEVKPIVEWRGEVALPCETGVCTAPPPPGVTATTRSSGFVGTMCDPTSSCIGQPDFCRMTGQCQG